MFNVKKIMNLDISGLGIIMYSDFAVAHIAEEEDYLLKKYMQPKDIIEHVCQGTIVGFGTGTSGCFNLHFKEGYPDESAMDLYEYKLRLGIEVRDKRICVRDLYDLMEWSADCPESQYIELDNGFYHITLCGNRPSSGILGENQKINVYLKKLDEMPNLKFVGAPIYCG